MSNNLAKTFKEMATDTTTENGRYAKSTTGNRLLDFFSICGALRTAEPSRITGLFEIAYSYSPLYATKALFYLRDIREGLGEKNTFRVIVKYMADNHPEALINNIKLFPEYGTFYDLYLLKGTKLEKDMISFLKAQLESDIKNLEQDKPVSLLAKWLDSPSSHSKNTKANGLWTAKALGYDAYTYKRIISKLRKKIDTVESYMANNDWDNIDYSKVPSMTMHKYGQTFRTHSPDKFNEYINSLKKGETKINSSTLYPSTIVGKLFKTKTPDAISEEQWKALPNYCDNDFNALVMADTSGSMYMFDDGAPINISIGLALYFAERNKGDFNNLFMTFSSKPSFVEVPKDTNLLGKILSMSKSSWGYSTNIDAAFAKILKLAIENKTPPEEMPASLIIISDMEFDMALDNTKVHYLASKEKFEAAGYKLPNLIYWNVSSRNNVFHASSKAAGVQLFSGASPSVFKSVMSAVGRNPEEAMMLVLNSPRYKDIAIAE